jgi:hypothetical protein
MIHGAFAGNKNFFGWILVPKANGAAFRNCVQSKLYREVKLALFLG